MSRTVKLGLYALCMIGLVISGTLTMRAYREASKSSELRKERLNRLTGIEPTNTIAATNLTEGATNVADAATNAESATNLTAATASTAATATDAATNTGPTNSGGAKAAAAKPAGEGTERTEAAGGPAHGYATMVTRGLVAVLCLMGLAVLIGYDVSHFVGQRAQELMFSDEGQPSDPEYEKAEQMWADGQYLEAVRAMREYLEKNPREQYVALRIAEIYEANLNNPLAAALEYEEVLKKKLPPERWGWAAIHLANLYSGKLSKPDKAVELLRRIDADYGQTGAAKKARERLLQIDPDFVPSTTVAAATEAAPEPESPPAARPESNLPPGFRPKS